MNLPKEAKPIDSADSASGEGQSVRRMGELQKTMTMAQIAKAAGVSQGAISSLLNDRDYGIRVSEKTRERVFKICREMGYVPNDLRAVVRMYPELGEFCLLVSSKIRCGLCDPFLSRIAHAAMGAVADPARALTVAVYDEMVDYIGDTDALPHPVRTGIFSKFMCYGPPNLTLFQSLTKRGFPIVSLFYEVNLPGVHSFVPDFAQASRLAIEHLAGLGHQRVGIVSGPFGSTAPQFVELNHGVRLACDEFRIPLEAQNLAYGELTEKAGELALDELLARSPAPTALFCMSDGAAAGVLTRAHAKGLRVPEDLSVIGCSDDACTRYLQPNLTTIHLPAEEMGAAAVAQIEHLIRANALRPAGKTVLPASLSLRGSTAAPASTGRQVG